MHRRILFGLSLMAFFALPLAAYAAIPFFGPIIDKAWMQCPLGWGALINVINNIISLLITIAIVFIAPIMIAYAGFLFVVNPVNPEGKKKAKGILMNTIFGIIIALAGWMIVDAVMAVLYNKGAPGLSGKTWSELITSGGIPPCLDVPGSLKQADQPSATTPAISGACPASLSPITDPLALQMEDGRTVVWDNTDPKLKPCADKLIRLMSAGTVTSAYRPQAYQTHLYEIRDRWCSRGLKSNTDPVCSSLKSIVSTEVTKHGLSACGAVAPTNSTHGSGKGVDISGFDQSSLKAKKNAELACLRWANYENDPHHYNLDLSISGCSCN